MKKTLQIAALLLAGYSASAHDFIYKIPANAQAVATLKSSQLVDLLSVKEFNQSFVGKMILKDLSPSRSEPFTSIRDYGISLTENTYYYTRITDSIAYQCVLLPLADAQKFEQLVARKHHRSESIERNGSVRKIVLSTNDHSMLIWNDELAILVIANLKEKFFNDEQVTARYGIEEETATAVDTVAAEMTAPSVMEAYAVAPPPPKAPKKKGRASYSKKNKKPQIVEVEAVPAAVEEVYPEDSYNDYSDQKDKLAMTWVDAYAEKVMRKSEGSSSILDNEAYASSQDLHATASIYIANLQDIYSGFINNYSSARYLGRMVRGYNNINAKLYLGDKTARITSEVMLSDRKAEMYRNIYSRKMNPDFVKYVNSDKVIGFMGYSLDTKAYLEEMPKLMQQTYGSYLGLRADKYKQEMDLGADLFSLLLDEEAVSKVIKGDALFLFNGVSSKTVTYKTYDYNSDNYERKEVEKTKTETLPDFLMMLSSDDTRLLRKLLKYGIDKNEVALKDGIYSMSGKSMKSPMVIHLLIKDGIVFLGTSMRDIQDIRDDRYEAHISKAQKSLILDNTISIYFNPRMLEGKIPQKEIGSFRKWTEFNTFMGNTGLLYARSNGIRGNVISGEVVAEVPEGKGNALQYFFGLIETIANKD